jgi:hypothetical protein
MVYLGVVAFAFFIPQPSSLLIMATTPEGKAKSRMNAMKHGLRATDELFLACLTRRERDVFESFRASLHGEYSPRTPHEKLLVDRIVIQHFRLFRLYRLEDIATRHSSRAPLSRESIIPHLDRFSRYDWRIERGLRVLHNRLRSLYQQRGDHSLNFFSAKE